MSLNTLYLRSRTDPTYIDRVFQAVHKRAEMLAWRYQHPDPEAFAQDCCTRVWEIWSKLPETRSPGGYMVGVIKKELRNQWGKRQQQIPVEQTEDDDGTHIADRRVITTRGEDRDVTVITDERKRKIAALLVLGYSVVEIAHQMGCSIKTIKRIAA